ncbi:lipopolysaccharide biosynthesis protein [Flammeovirga agarivorans]|uniref:Oligosaccharide flippase family protein n=1 Tax=Flammeovirga agarivorans TaxID=2726742 RepID=A0A7X8XUM1_9BACT|nr:oligosaccharide flippase family protein [Flammeovirga agarivorans]NLR90512.1 oligosaccharide flippase family protein [Flammeovirga agarivorans]
MIKKIKKNINENPFIKNTLTLVSSSVIAQIFTVLSAPILYRLYTKENYGILGSFIAISTITNLFSSFQYLQPIILEKDDNESIKLVHLNIFLNLIGTVTYFVIIIILLYKSIAIKYYFLLPLTYFLNGQSEIISTWLNRNRQFNVISKATIIQSISTPIISFISYYIYKNERGLFTALILSQFIQFIFFVLNSNIIKKLDIKNFNPKTIILKIKQYKSFPLMRVPSELMNRLTSQSPILMFSIYSTPEFIGVYNLCTRMLGIPIQLIGNNIAKVFKEKAISDYNNLGNFNLIFLKTFKSLFLISVLPLIIVMFKGPIIFSFFFGETWKDAGNLAQILIPLYLLKLIVSPLSYSYFIKNKLKEDLVLHVYLMISNIIILHQGFELGFDNFTIISIYSINFSFIYIIYILRSYTFSK